MTSFFARSGLFMLGLLCATACQRHTENKTMRIGFSQCCNDPWRDVMNAEMLREMSFHPDAELEMAVAGNDNAAQIAQIQQMAEAGVDLLIVSPNESAALTPAIEQVQKAGIPVILIDRKITSDAYTAYVGADNYSIGSTAAQYLANLLPDGGQIIEIQLPLTLSPAVERHRGFQDAIGKAGKLRIVESLELEDHSQLGQLLPPILERHPEAKVIFGHTDLIAESAHAIAGRMGRAERMVFIGVDGIPGTGRGIQAVQDGVLDASLLYPTGGAEAIRLAMAILNNLPFEKHTHLESVVITKENARILHHQMEKVNDLQAGIDRQLRVLDRLQSIYRNQRQYILILLVNLGIALALGGFLWRSLRAKKTMIKTLEQKNIEILEHERQIIAMSEALEKATKAKVDFFTNISHEFRTPLTLIMGFAEDMIASKKLARDMRQSIGQVRRNALRLLDLVNQLMAFRRVESDQMRLRAREGDILAFVRHIATFYDDAAKRHGVELRVLSREEQIKLWFDSQMIEKVLFNLVSNAFKFTPKGGCISLIVSVDSFGQSVNITVEDNGKGIDSKDLEHIFEAFFQGENALLSGTGLGLALSKSLVELHGGRISAQSQKGKGSRFTVSLPLGQQHLGDAQLASNLVEDSPYAHEFYDILAEEEIEDPDAEDGQGGDEEGKREQILIIEDSSELQAFLRKHLRAHYSVLQAESGERGLQEAFSKVPDLIICDIMMPQGNGLDVVRSLKGDLRSSHIPIIILSARSSTEQQIEGIECGADLYLTKPFNIHMLLVSIKTLLTNRQILKASFSSKMQQYLAPAHADSASDKRAAELDRDFIVRFVQYIDENYFRQDFQINDLCTEFQLSRSQLYRKAKALLGESITDYLQNARLSKAEQLLAEGIMPIADIAYQVGYSSPNYFSTVFRLKYGVSPSAYRNQKPD